MLESLTKFYEISEKIGHTMGMISSSIGFLGLECIILLLVSFVLLFFRYFPYLNINFTPSNFLCIFFSKIKC